MESLTTSRGRNTRLTLALCALNVIAALGFIVLLFLDFQKRQDWSYATFMNELAIEGLPLKQEEDGVSASRATLPRQKLDSRQIQSVFASRGGESVDTSLPSTQWATSGTRSPIMSPPSAHSQSRRNAG